MDGLKAITRVTCCVCLFLNFGRSASVPHCTQSYTTDDGKTCSYCPPGTYVASDCGQSGQSANCHGCEPGYYQSNCTRATSCEKCLPSCRWPYTIKVKGCTLYHDIICQCVPGRYWQKETDKDGVCLRHSMCGPGSGLVALGSATDDTLCEPCINGWTFSSDNSIERCHACSKCKVYINICTATRDAVCDNSSSTETPLESVTNTKGGSNNVTVIVVTVTFSVVALVIIATVAICLYRGRNDSYEVGNTPGNTRGIENHNVAFVPEAVPSDNHGGLGRNTSHSNIDITTGNNAEITQTTLEITTDNLEAATPYTDDEIRKEEYDSTEITNGEYSLALANNFPDKFTGYKSDRSEVNNIPKRNRDETKGQDVSFPNDIRTESIKLLDKTLTSSSSLDSNEPFIAEETNKLNSVTDDSVCSSGLYVAESGQQIMELKSDTVEEIEIAEMNRHAFPNGIEETCHYLPIGTQTISLSGDKQNPTG